MKAILITDMPKKCVECSLANRDTIVEFCKITGKEIPIIFSSNEEDEEIINDDCPLKPMPSKYELTTEKGNRYAVGWNDCIDEILREKDD